MGTLALKGPKHLSLDPGIPAATLGSMVALKATLTLSEAEDRSLGLTTLPDWKTPVWSVT